MKKFCILLAVIFLITVCGLTCTIAENKTFKINNVVYNMYELNGSVTVPEGDFYARVTLFIDNDYIVFTEKIVDNAFTIHVMSTAHHISVQIVDKPDAFIAGTYNCYAATGMDL